MVRTLAITLAALAALMGHAAPATEPPARPAAAAKPRPPAWASAPISTLEAKLLASVNAERAQRGLSRLEWDASLCMAGRGHSREMATLDYFDHSSPTPGMETPADRWEQVVTEPPADYVLGENLFYGSVTDAAWAHRSLMESAGHRDNILNPRYKRVGIGIYTAPDGRMWVTEMFLS